VVYGLWLMVQELGFRDQSFGFRVSDFGFRVSKYGFRNSGSGCRGYVYDVEFRSKVRVKDSRS
jgi:hypothetical protein